MWCGGYVGSSVNPAYLGVGVGAAFKQAARLLLGLLLPDLLLPPRPLALFVPPPLALQVAFALERGGGGGGGGGGSGGGGGGGGSGGG